MVVFNRNFLILSLVLSLAACSLDGKFEETQQINLAPFSENVTAMASELDYSFDNIRSLQTRWYFDVNSPKLKRLLNLEKLITNEIRFIVEYSSRIVYLSESNLPMVEKTTELSLFIKKMYARYANSKTLTITAKQKSDIIASMTQQEKFLPALRAAQPFINELSRYVNRMLDQLKKAEKNLAFYLDKKIDTENKHLKSLILSLKKNEVEISNAVVLLNNYENGNDLAFDELKKSRVLLQQSMINTKKELSESQIGLLKKHLLNRLTENTNFFKQIEPSFNRYQLAQKELSSLVKEHDTEIRKIRLIFIAFASAHRKMASGIVKSAQWFDIRDTPKLLLKLLPM